MHILRTLTPNREAEHAVDLGQTPADMVILSAADSDFLPIQAAAHRLNETEKDFPTLRLAHLLSLGHPASIDLYADKIMSQAKIVLVRLLGGVRYWPYGVEMLRRLADEKPLKLAMIDGEARLDAELAAKSNITPEILARLHEYFALGGGENAAALLRVMAALAANRPINLADFPTHPAIPPFGRSRLVTDHDLPHHAPRAKIIYYRALEATGDVAPIQALAAAMAARGVKAMPIFVPSLKDAAALAFLRQHIAPTPPDLIITLTHFAASPFASGDALNFAASDCPILQGILSSDAVETWQSGSRGLSPRDLAMAVMLPELDGRLHGRVISFKQIATPDGLTQFATARHQPVAALVDSLADLAAAWIKLRHKPNHAKKIALMLGNYPVRDGRIANGVGLDTPQAVIDSLLSMGIAGYEIGTPPRDTKTLMDQLTQGPTNDLARRKSRETEILADPATIFYRLGDYQREFAKFSPQLQKRVMEKWGIPATDPFLARNPGGELGFPLAARLYQNIVVMVQPPRGYELAKSQQNYHDPALIPPHYYWASYLWLRTIFNADALVQMGKHGTLEWLPGKAVGLSPDCVPLAMLGAMPVIYPFIVNDPGEGSQAKRRSAAVIIDHLTPPLTQAGSYGEAAQLEALLDEYDAARHLDAKRVAPLLAAITELAEKSGLATEAGLQLPAKRDGFTEQILPQLDAYLCDLKEWQIRDGLHRFGQSPGGASEAAMLLALSRVPRGSGQGADASLLRALAADFDLRSSPNSVLFDPLTDDLSAVWRGGKPQELLDLSEQPWRHSGDTLERLEIFAQNLISHLRAGGSAREAIQQNKNLLTKTQPVLNWITTDLAPRLKNSGKAEMAALLASLSGRFVAPGPSGAPSRGRPDVLPTGRNFYALDARGMPTQAAWRLGWHSACLMLERHLQDQGEDLRHVVLSCWGTAQMRTGGDDIAQALALLGVQPLWEPESGRVIGFEIMPVTVLGRPRVDVTLRISGFFRDAFANLIDLFDRASRAVAAIPTDLESAEENPLAQACRQRTAALCSEGIDQATAQLLAGYRVFGAQPGSYGAGLQHIMDHNQWQTDAELAAVFLAWGRFAYGSDGQGGAVAGDERLAVSHHHPSDQLASWQESALKTLLAASQAVVQNQDNREHDLLDSDDYYQFEGGLAATIKHLSGSLPAIYHNDHALPEKPVIRTLSEELTRVIRARLCNPRWLDGVRLHGYKGAAEMAASLDYLAAFQALTHLVTDAQIDRVYAALLGDEVNLEFLRAHNPAALRELADKFQHLLDRGLWQSRRNATLMEIRGFLGG